MTSTNDGKDVKSNQTSGPKGKSYYIELYRSLDGALCGSAGVETRASQLCAAWRAVHTLCLHSAPPTHPHLAAWIQRHTATTVLQSEWSKLTEGEEHKHLEEAINDFIEECRNAAATRNGVSLDWETQLVERGEWFKSILANPWGHPVLRVLLDPRGQPPSDEEVIAWLRSERGVSLSCRVRQLAGSRCGDLALRLAQAVLQRARDAATDLDYTNGPFAKILREEAGFTSDIWDLLIDIEFVLLHKGDKRSKCIELAKQSPLENAYQLIERLQARVDTLPREKKIWKNCKEVATLIAQVSIARCMVVPLCAGEARKALYCCTRALVRLLRAGRLPAAAAALAAPAATAAHLHTLAAAVHAQTAPERTPFVCELYVRAITAGMNELERLKLDDDKEDEARSAEKQLAAWLLQLGSLLGASARLRCECVLTAFSVHPAPLMYDKIKDAPILPPPPTASDTQDKKEEETMSEFGSWATDSRSLTNFVKTSETLNLKHTQQQANVLSTAIFSEGETLGLSPELCQDIAVLLSGPRLKTLSWDMDRAALLVACKSHMARTCGGTRAAPTPKPLLGQDYAHLPEQDEAEEDSDLYYGIEKGYEHLIELYREPEEIWKDVEDIDIAGTADSVSDGESSVTARRKKTNKKQFLSSAEESDTDPLSVVAEAKKAAKKKERPHSKERSKERKPKTKTKTVPQDILLAQDPLATDTDQQTDATEDNTVVVKEKKKRERKKKDRPDKPPKVKSDKKSTNAAVATPANPSILSATPNVQTQLLGNLADVSQKVTNSAEDIKSLLTTTEESTVAKNNTSNLMSSVLINTPLAQSNSKALNKNIKVQPTTSIPINPYKPVQESCPLVQRHDAVNAKVKNSITKLLQFRREKALERMRNNAPKPPNTISKPSQIPLQGLIRPKVVDIPDIPKVVINKQQSEKLIDLKNEVHQLLNKQNQSLQQPVIQYARPSNKANNPLNLSQANKDKHTAGYASESSIDNSKLINVPENRSKFNKDSPSQKEFYEFLQELQKSINAGTNRDLVNAQSSSAGNVPRLVNRPALPTNPEPKPSQSAKSLAQQNKSDALNTFSRLSYMHKHSKNDSNKLKQTETALERPEHTRTSQSIPRNIEHRVQGHMSAVTNSYIPTQHSTILSTSNALNNTAPRINTTMSETVRNHPLVANILQNHSVAKFPSETRPWQARAEQPRDLSMPSTKQSALGEKDQNDLLSLARQKKKQNETRPRSHHKSTKNVLENQFSELQSILNWNPNRTVPSTSSDTKASSQILGNSRAPHAVRSQDKKVQHIPRDTVRPRQPSEKDTASLKNMMLKTDTLSNKEVGSDKNKTSQKQAEWQNVLDMLRSHNTPSRGPKALELTLTNERGKITNQKTTKGQPSTSSAITLEERNKIPHPNVDANKLESHISNNIPTAKRKDNMNTLSKDIKIVPIKQHTKQTESIPIQFEPAVSALQVPKRSYQNQQDQSSNISVIKKPADTLKRQFTCSLPKTDDPFISGIPNSDYDLLEELMDDDLRQEIGELSDDDNFVSSAQVLKDLKHCVNSKASGNIIPSQPDNQLVKPIPMSSRLPEQNIQKSTKCETVLKINVPMHSPTTPPALVNISVNKNTPKTNAVLPPSCNNSSRLIENEQASAVNSPNAFVAAIPQQTDLTNVLVIGSDIVYQTVQSHPVIGSLSPTIVTYNNQPNMAIYQTTQFAAPVVSPCIIANASISTKVNSNKTNSNSPVVGKTNEDPKTKASLIPNKHATQKQKPKKSKHGALKQESGVYDLNSNKNCDRKILSVVQDKRALRDKKHTKKVKPQRPSNDRNEGKKDLRSQERLKQKRMAILNREVHHKTHYEPIPLPYASLETKRADFPKSTLAPQASGPDKDSDKQNLLKDSNTIESSVPLNAIDISRKDNNLNHVNSLLVSSKIEASKDSLKKSYSASSYSVEEELITVSEKTVNVNKHVEIITEQRGSKRKMDRNDIQIHSSVDIPSKQLQHCNSNDKTSQISETIHKHLDVKDNRTILNETSQVITKEPTAPSTKLNTHDENHSRFTNIDLANGGSNDNTNKGDSVLPPNECVQNNKKQDKPISNEITASDKTNLSKSVDSELSSIPQSYKDSIIIENIPNDASNDPYNKCVRIKLPNGRVFKATVRGKVHVNFDTLFSDPKIKNVLLSNITDRKRYTLNIKQIAPLTPHSQPEKPRIQEVQFRSAPEINTLKTNQVETINLLSDDDEDDSCNFLETEFGKFKLSSTSSVNLLEHQKRFRQKSFVKLKRTPGSTALVEINKNKLDNLNEDSAKNTVPEIIDLADSSDDEAADISNEGKSQNVDQESSDSLKNIMCHSKGNLDDSYTQNDDNSKGLLPQFIENETFYEPNITTALDDIIELSNSSFEDTTPNIETPKSHVSCKKCYVKLHNCDYLVKYYESFNVSPESNAVVGSDLQCAEVLESSDTEVLDDSDVTICPDEGVLQAMSDISKSGSLSRAGSFSILNDFSAFDIDVPPEVIERNSSPVIDVFEAIAALNYKNNINMNVYENEYSQSIDICLSEWHDLKTDLRIRYNECLTNSGSKNVEERDGSPQVTTKVPSLSFISTKYFQSHPYVIDRFSEMNNTLPVLKRKSSSSSYNTSENKTFKSSTAKYDTESPLSCDNSVTEKDEATSNNCLKEKTSFVVPGAEVERLLQSNQQTPRLELLNCKPNAKDYNIINTESIKLTGESDNHAIWSQEGFGNFDRNDTEKKYNQSISTVLKEPLINEVSDSGLAITNGIVESTSYFKENVTECDSKQNLDELLCDKDLLQNNNEKDNDRKNVSNFQQNGTFCGSQEARHERNSAFSNVAENIEKYNDSCIENAVDDLSSSYLSNPDVAIEKPDMAKSVTNIVVPDCSFLERRSEISNKSSLESTDGSSKFASIARQSTYSFDVEKSDSISEDEVLFQGFQETAKISAPTVIEESSINIVSECNQSDMVSIESLKQLHSRSNDYSSKLISNELHSTDCVHAVRTPEISDQSSIGQIALTHEMDCDLLQMVEKGMNNHSFSSQETDNKAIQNLIEESIIEAESPPHDSDATSIQALEKDYSESTDSASKLPSTDCVDVENISNISVNSSIEHIVSTHEMDCEPIKMNEDSVNIIDPRYEVEEDFQGSSIEVNASILCDSDTTTKETFKMARTKATDSTFEFALNEKPCIDYLDVEKISHITEMRNEMESEPKEMDVKSMNDSDCKYQQPFQGSQETLNTSTQNFIIEDSSTKVEASVPDHLNATLKQNTEEAHSESTDSSSKSSSTDCVDVEIMSEINDKTCVEHIVSTHEMDVELPEIDEKSVNTDPSYEAEKVFQGSQETANASAQSIIEQSGAEVETCLPDNSDAASKLTLEEAHSEYTGSGSKLSIIDCGDVEMISEINDKTSVGHIVLTHEIDCKPIEMDGTSLNIDPSYEAEEVFQGSLVTANLPARSIIESIEESSTEVATSISDDSDAASKETFEEAISESTHSGLKLPTADAVEIISEINEKSSVGNIMSTPEMEPKLIEIDDKSVNIIPNFEADQTFQGLQKTTNTSAQSFIEKSNIETEASQPAYSELTSMKSLEKAHTEATDSASKLPNTDGVDVEIISEINDTSSVGQIISTSEMDCKTIEMDDENVNIDPNHEAEEVFQGLLETANTSAQSVIEESSIETEASQPADSESTSMQPMEKVHSEATDFVSKLPSTDCVPVEIISEMNGTSSVGQIISTPEMDCKTIEMDDENVNIDSNHQPEEVFQGLLETANTSAQSVIEESSIKTEASQPADSESTSMQPMEEVHTEATDFVPKLPSADCVAVEIISKMNDTSSVGQIISISEMDFKPIQMDDENVNIDPNHESEKVFQGLLETANTSAQSVIEESYIETVASQPADSELTSIKSLEKAHTEATDSVSKLPSADGVDVEIISEINDKSSVGQIISTPEIECKPIKMDDENVNMDSNHEAEEVFQGLLETANTSAQIIIEESNIETEASRPADSELTSIQPMEQAHSEATDFVSKLPNTDCVPIVIISEMDDTSSVEQIISSSEMDRKPIKKDDENVNIDPNYKAEEVFQGMQETANTSAQSFIEKSIIESEMSQPADTESTSIQLMEKAYSDATDFVSKLPRTGGVPVEIISEMNDASSVGQIISTPEMDYKPIEMDDENVNIEPNHEVEKLFQYLLETANTSAQSIIEESCIETEASQPADSELTSIKSLEKAHTEATDSVSKLPSTDGVDVEIISEMKDTTSMGQIISTSEMDCKTIEMDDENVNMDSNHEAEEVFQGLLETANTSAQSIIEEFKIETEASQSADSESTSIQLMEQAHSEATDFVSKLPITDCVPIEIISEMNDTSSAGQIISSSEMDCKSIQMDDERINSNDEKLIQGSQATNAPKLTKITASDSNSTFDSPVVVDTCQQLISESPLQSPHSANPVELHEYGSPKQLNTENVDNLNIDEDSMDATSKTKYYSIEVPIKLEFSYDLQVVSINDEKSQSIDGDSDITENVPFSGIEDEVANIDSNEDSLQNSLSTPDDDTLHTTTKDKIYSSSVSLFVAEENETNFSNNPSITKNVSEASDCNEHDKKSIESFKKLGSTDTDDILYSCIEHLPDDKLRRVSENIEVNEDRGLVLESSKSTSLSVIEPVISEIVLRNHSKIDKVKNETKHGQVLDHACANSSTSEVNINNCDVVNYDDRKFEIQLLKPIIEKSDEDVLPSIPKNVEVLPEFDINSVKESNMEINSSAEELSVEGEQISEEFSSHTYTNILKNENISFCENNDSIIINTSDDSEIHLRGIEYEDPDMGTLYVFPIVTDILDTEVDNGTDSNSSHETHQSLEIHDDVELKLIIPKITYSRKSPMDMNDNDSLYSNLRNRNNLKRKIKASDIVNPKKYRKGKGIDYPRTTTSAIEDTNYGKQFKSLIDYTSTIKFSYSIPFHKEDVEVLNLLQDWPLKGPCNDVVGNTSDTEDFLFNDLEDKPSEPHVERLKQLTLAEEIDAGHNHIDDPSVEVNETNFSMGFGERSDRVIQNFNVVGDISKYSAATLSDVKQFQPLLLSESMRNISCNRTRDEIEKICRHVTHLQVREKVKAFFKNTTDELHRDWLTIAKKDSYGTLENSCPFGLNLSEFIEPLPAQQIVYVVQVGQLPVSAAAQNPVTCDPRVTQVSDISPSQCSAENSPNDDPHSTIKTEYTELTTADISLPMVQDYEQHNHDTAYESQESLNTIIKEEMPIEAEMKSIVKIELEEEIPEEMQEHEEHTEPTETHVTNNNNLNHVDFSFPNQSITENSIENTHDHNSEIEDLLNAVEKQSAQEHFPEPKLHNGTPEKTDQIAHAMNAAGISTMAETITSTTTAQALVNILSHKMRQNSGGGTPAAPNTYTKTTSINAMSLQQALAQILPPPLNHTNGNDNQQAPSNSGPPVLHIVQGKNSSGNQITLVDNSQQSVINNAGGTPVLHIVQNKSAGVPTSNGNAGPQTNSFSGLSLVDAGLQQGGNQLLHIVNTGNQKTTHAGQILKRVNLLTNLTNVQGSNEQKMVQFLCKSADGKSIQLNAPHQRSMVLRLQPVETPPAQPQAAQSKPLDSQEVTSSPNAANPTAKDDATSPQEIKSRSVYEENYAKFIQNSSNKSTVPEKATSLPKFGQAFGKQVFQDGTQKQDDVSHNGNAHANINTNGESSECQPNDNDLNLDHISQIGSPPLLLRKSPQTSQAQPNLVQQIKQTMAPMNMTMHGGVIYTRQIPVNIGPGKTINLITVPSTELDESGQKPQSEVKFINQGEMEPSIIKIVPQSQPTPNAEVSTEENGAHMNATNDNTQTPQPQPVLTQMRIKLPMLSKNPQMVAGARVVRPSFFQIQRNVIGGANQPVYQQLVLTAAPPLGQQTIRLPQAQPARQVKVPTESQSSPESQMSSSTLEQLREFDLVLEQVKERSTVQPSSSSSSSSPFSKIHTTPSTDTTDSVVSSASATPTETTQPVLYSVGNTQPVNVAYVSRKSAVATPSTSSYVRSPDSSGIADSSSSSSHIPHTVTSDSSTSGTPAPSKPSKSSKSKSRPKASSNPPNTLKLNTVPAKTSSQKPLEDEQTTQRILYILAEYKEQVENSPDKDKPAPRRRSNPPSNPSGSSKRKKSSSGSRRPGGRDTSPVHGDDTSRTMGSEDSSCASQGDCTESCLDSHSPQDSPRKVARKIAFEQEAPAAQPRPLPQRNVIVADGQAIAVARAAAGKPATAVLMPANYILPVSMVKGGQQIAIVTNRGPKLLVGEGGANTLLLQRLIGPGGLKPVLRPGVRHVRLQGLTALNVAPPAPAAPAPQAAPAPEPLDSASPWPERDSDVKPERGSSPEGSEPWPLPSAADPDYGYEDAVRTDALDRTVLDHIPDRYSPDMEAQRIFDKMFDVDSKRSYMVDSQDDSPRCGFDIDASDCSDKAYQVVQKRDGSQRHRLTHVSAAALRHKYAILEHELRLQKSLSEECEDLGVDSPSAAELFPEAELLFASSPAYDHTQEMHHDHTSQPTLLSQSGIPQPDMDDQIATDELLARAELDERGDLGLALDEVGEGACAAGLRGLRPLDHEEFARAHPNTTFHSEPTNDGEIQPFTLSGGRGRQVTSTIFQTGRGPGTVLVAGPQATVISQPQLGAKEQGAGPPRRGRYDSSPERDRPDWGDSSSSRCGASDSDKCCLSPSDEATSADEGAPPPRVQSVIRQARARHREAPPRTYPPQRAAGGKTAARGGKTRAGERRASGRGVVRRACPCCGGDPLPSRAKRPRPRH